jgi:hypothetical protein
MVGGHVAIARDLAGFRKKKKRVVALDVLLNLHKSRVILDPGRSRPARDGATTRIQYSIIMNTQRLLLK